MPQEEKKTFISRNTVLLQGGGRTNIEYSAGPNINITNDVISGKDWSQDIDDAVNSATSGKADVSAIPTVIDYSAGDNIDITDHVVSGKDWTQDIVDTVESAISANAPQEYSAGSNINIENHIISGKDWSNEIDQKLDTSAFQETISSFATKYELSSTSSEIIDIISATSGQGGGGSCPWISGGKDYGSATVQLNFGDTIPVFSSWDLSGDHNHYIWMKGANVRLPDGSEFLPNSAFSGYTASMANIMENNWNYTNSAYSMSLTNHYNKLENSAFSAYTAAHSADDVIPYSGGNGIEVNDHTISFTGEAGSNYSAGANINITDNVISGKDWNNEISAASSILNQMIASGDNVAYSAGSNINVTNHVISGKDWATEINAATSGKLNSSWTAGKDVTPYSAGSNINVTNHVISGKDWTNTIDEHIASAISSVDIPSAKMVSGVNGIQIEELSDRVVFSVTGDPGTPYLAGANINITNHVVSGKNWSNDITAAISSWSAGKDVTPYSAGSNINITNHVVSVTGQMGKVYSGISPINVDNITDQISLDPPEWTLCAGPNINISADEMNYELYISGAAGSKVSYFYNTPVTSISSNGDLLISRQVASTTPDKIKVQVGSSDVGLLLPTNTGHNSMLVTNAMGSVQWADQSAVLPSAVEQTHKVRVYSNDSTYSGENALNDYPATDHDWEFTIINQYATSSNWLYYSAGGATATLYPGKGVRVYYCQNTDTLYSEPEFIADFGDDYATRWGDLDGLKLRAVGTSAEASANGILYVVTGGN